MFVDPRKVLARHGLVPKRGFSQNFLCSPHAVERIAAATGADAGDVVVELGPGCGTLTGAILARGARVLAIERDPDMIAVLAAELTDTRLAVRSGDATRVDYGALRQELAAPLRVTGNLPYALTGAILRGLIEGVAQLHSAVVMVQKEVAERLLAAPGASSYGALTVFAQRVFEVELVMRVPAASFHPRPKVDSAVVRLVPRPTPRATSPGFARVVRAAFQARRKTLRNALGQLPDVSPRDAEAALARAGLPADIRGERLSVEQFDALARLLEPGSRASRDQD